MKAEDIINIDLRGKTSIADSMFIATGRSTRQVAAIADHVYRKLKHTIGDGCKLEGMQKADWVLLDAGNIIIHVFRAEVRSFYNLEKMWAADFTPDKMTETPESSEDE
ncbi:MAG: ribosome silencing factor [Emcibacteraceae bacterium]|nr:ribosome silencing factor [Emcibacteraceae bacterium]